jgi:hypothetical protein
MNGKKHLNTEEQVCLTKLDQGARQHHAFEDHIERANALIQEERRITVSEVAEIPDIRQTETCNSQR